MDQSAFEFTCIFIQILRRWFFKTSVQLNCSVLHRVPLHVQVHFGLGSLKRVDDSCVWLIFITFIFLFENFFIRYLHLIAQRLNWILRHLNKDFLKRSIPRKHRSFEKSISRNSRFLENVIFRECWSVEIFHHSKWSIPRKSWFLEIFVISKIYFFPKINLFRKWNVLISR